MMDALLLRPFQFPDSRGCRFLDPLRTPNGNGLAADYRDWKDQTRSVQSLVGWEGLERHADRAR